MERLYFDYNATAPLSPGVKEQLPQWLSTDFKNPSSVHQDGQSSKTAVERARRSILKILGAASKDKLFFTSGGTESNNMVLHSAFLHRGQRRTLLLTRIEHSCVYNYANALAAQGVRLEWIEVDRHGQVDLDDFARKLTDDVFLVCTMLANNETGYILPVRELAEMARAKGVPMLCDVVCAAGKIPVSFAELGVEFMTFSSHKFGGLKGIGGVICRADAKISPLVLGGPQEDEKRAGTQNVWGILSSAVALEDMANGLAEAAQHCSILRDRMKAVISAAYPRAVFNESRQNLAQTLSVSFPGLSGALLLTNLDLEGVSCSYGSACASGALEVSRVIRELKLPFDEARSTLRFSFGRCMTEANVEDFGQRFKRVVERITAAN